jgi:CIC family chloride channel protein
LEIVIIRDLMSPLPNTDSPSSPLPEVFAYSDNTCRSAAEIMATEGSAVLPVVDRATNRISGSISLQDLLKGRSKAVVRENERLTLMNRPE